MQKPFLSKIEGGGTGVLMLNCVKDSYSFHSLKLFISFFSPLRKVDSSQTEVVSGHGPSR